MPLSILRSRAFLLSAAITLIVLLATWQSPYRPHFSRPSHVEKTVGLHMIAPATSSNENLCRLLASSIISRYPDPILLGWGMTSAGHLFKVPVIMEYLNNIPPEQDDDLVLLVDAFDVWFQLSPDVMIKRYHTALKRHEDRLQREGILGKRQYRSKQEGDEYITKTTLMWGGDKLCWPQQERRAACWAAPDIPDMADDALGPIRPWDNKAMMPKWLNSGTLMGPAKDMRDMFNATMEMMDMEYDVNYMFSQSDQQYFADVWAEQEVNRVRLAKGMDAVYGPRADSEVPLFIPDRRTEYHIAIDHMSEVFQTNAFYSDFITWMRFNRSHPTPDYPNQKPFNLLPSSSPGRLDHLKLEQDVTDSPGPYSAAVHSTDNLPFDAKWEDVMLGTNTITGQPFPLYHITGDKTLRDRWWPRMWFHNPSAERLLQASLRQRKHAGLGEGSNLAQSDPHTALGAAPRDQVVTVVDGVSYVARDPRGKSSGDVDERQGDKGGAWSDSGAYLPWDSLCSEYEKAVFVQAKEY